MTEAFVYRWRHQTGIWYIGFHKGTANDGYICSSVIAKPLIQENPDEWTRKILRYGTKQDMLALERRILKRLNARKNPKSLNRSNGGVGAPLSIADQLGYDLNAMTANEIAEHYIHELTNGSPRRIFLFDKWLLKRVLT
jgi:hypothetical protein